jgi:hypothetical protein
LKKYGKDTIFFSPSKNEAFMGVFYAYPTVYEKNTFQGWIGMG